ncbi:MAG: flagellar motor switch phosphatase FliY [Oscillospiraceae bacterium]|nr:flagellar motor switch phosphatase FliY [Oscillospiraceae bacterium]
MNLSQDEIQTLLADDALEDDADVVSEEIMSPEEIAAMLDETAGEGSGDGDLGSDDTMNLETIAADAENSDSADGVDILDGSAAGAADTPVEPSKHTNDSSISENAISGMLTDEEVDILGEIGNISMGAVATTMYSLLDRRVSITTPRVNVYNAKDVLSIYKIPFVVATIEYVEGIDGTNLLVLKVEDAALITNLLMGGDGVVPQPIELSELHISAMSEIMNQMMGASSTSLSKLLKEHINISPPKSIEVDAGFDVSILFDNIDMVTKISFDMEIDGLLKSELIQLMPYDVSRDFAKRFMHTDISAPASMSPLEKASAEVQPKPPLLKTQSPQTQPSQTPTPPVPSSPQSNPHQQQSAVPAASYAQGYQQQSPYYPQHPSESYPSYPAQGQGRLVDVHPMQFQAFDAPSLQGESKGIGLVYNIPLQVTVELGKTKKEISEILEFNTGTIVVLDKVAGDPVEIVVNGKLIARGEVVVIDDNYGVRITDIMGG